jgi:hypothetical protein
VLQHPLTNSKITRVVSISKSLIVLLPAPSLNNGCLQFPDGGELLFERRDRIFIFVHIDCIAHLRRTRNLLRAQR